MINIFLSGADSNEEVTYEVIPGQKAISLTLLFIAFITVPLMLCVKPCWLNRAHKHHPHHEVSHNPERNSSAASEHQTSGQGETSSLLEGKMLGGGQRSNQADAVAHAISSEGKIEEPHSFGDLFIHQMIETIEFVLGTVSNTASYLRLWALSLAHSQLAGVFLEQVQKLAFSADAGLAVRGIMVRLLDSNTFSKSFNYLFQHSLILSLLLQMFICFLIFFSFTFFVLMCMDAMECFLHTLRLHWVEF